MFQIIRASFNQRERRLRTVMKNSPELHYTKEQIEAAIERLGKGARVRGEALNLEEFAALTNSLIRESNLNTADQRCKDVRLAAAGSACQCRFQEKMRLHCGPKKPFDRSPEGCCQMIPSNKRAHIQLDTLVCKHSFLAVHKYLIDISLYKTHFFSIIEKSDK